MFIINNRSPNFRSMFWNINGMSNFYLLDKSQLAFFSNLDFIFLSESWLTSIPSFEYLSCFDNFEVVFVSAIGSKTVGRPSSGILALISNKYKFEIISESPFWLFIHVFTSLSEFVIGNVYFRPDDNIKNTIDNFNLVVSEILYNFGHNVIYIGGDFNCRIGGKGNDDIHLFEGTFLDNCRTSMDITVNFRGDYLLDFMESHGFYVLNGRTKNDKPSNYTYIGHNGQSVVDLIWSKGTLSEVIRLLENKK